MRSFWVAQAQASAPSSFFQKSNSLDLVIQRQNIFSSAKQASSISLAKVRDVSFLSSSRKLGIFYLMFSSLKLTGAFAGRLHF